MHSPCHVEHRDPVGARAHIDWRKARLALLSSLSLRPLKSAAAIAPLITGALLGPSRVPSRPHNRTSFLASLPFTATYIILFSIGSFSLRCCASRVLDSESLPLFHSSPPALSSVPTPLRAQHSSLHIRYLSCAVADSVCNI